MSLAPICDDSHASLAPHLLPRNRVHLSAAEQAEAAKEGAHVNQSVLISGESVRRMLWSSIDPFDSPIDAHARALLCLGPIGCSHVRSPCPR